MNDPEQQKVIIDLHDMRSRAEHGRHLTNDEVRWLLAQVGYPVPRMRRCNKCNGEGEVTTHTWNPGVSYGLASVSECPLCHRSGYLPLLEPEYEVVR